MMPKFSSVHRTSVPFYNLCKYRLLHNCCKVKINLQQSSVMPCSSKPELNRLFYSNICKPVWSLGKWDMAHIDTHLEDRQDNSEDHSLNGRLPNCSILKHSDNIKSKSKFENDNGTCKVHTVLCRHEDYENITGLPRMNCNRLRSSSSDLSTVTSKYLFTVLKKMTVFQHGKLLFASRNSCGHKCISNHAGLILTNKTLLNTKKGQCLRLNSLFHTSARFSSNQQTQGISVRKQPPWRIMFFGTDDMALYTLKELHLNMTDSGTLVESLEVVTGKDYREVAAFAEKKNLKIHDWPLAVETGKYDVGVLASFGHLIPDDVIHMFPYGILNMHPSLLPRWRGASPVAHTILNNDAVTGVSIMDIRPKHFDIGPILLQRMCKVPQRCTTHELTEVLGNFGASMMLECLRDLPTLERFEHEQDEAGITYAHKIKYKNANIDWENNTAEQIDCQYRALAESIPLKTEYDGQIVKLLNVVDPSLFKDIRSKDVKGVKGDIMDAEPGTVGYHKPMKCIVVKCKRGLIGFQNIVLKKTLRATDFRNGYINKNEFTKYTKFASLDNDLNKYIKVKKLSMKAKG